MVQFHWVADHNGILPCGGYGGHDGVADSPIFSSLLGLQRSGGRSQQGEGVPPGRVAVGAA